MFLNKLLNSILVFLVLYMPLSAINEHTMIKLYPQSVVDKRESVYRRKLKHIFPVKKKKELIQNAVTGQFFQYHCSIPERDIFDNKNSYKSVIKYYEEMVKIQQAKVMYKKKREITFVLSVADKVIWAHIKAWDLKYQLTIVEEKYRFKEKKPDNIEPFEFDPQTGFYSNEETFVENDPIEENEIDSLANSLTLENQPEPEPQPEIPLKSIQELDLSPRFIFFDFDKFNILTTYLSDINSVLDIAFQNQELLIEIIGHTDDIGSNDYNINLSFLRANSVKNFLLKAGLDVNRTKIQYFGYHQPMLPNSNEINRSKNRRVEIRLIQPNS